MVQDFRAASDYYIMDDVAWETVIKGTGEFFKGLHQEDFSATDRYCRKFHIPWGKPVIILTNKKVPFLDEDLARWIEINCLILNVGQLY